MKELYKAVNSYIYYTEEIKRRSQEIMEISKIKTECQGNESLEICLGGNLDVGC